MGFWSTKRRPLATNCSKCGMSELLTSCGITDFKQEECLGEGAKKVAFVAPPRLLDELALGKKYENSYVGRQFADIARPYIDLHRDAIIIPATQCPIVIKKRAGADAGKLVDVDKFMRVGCCRDHLARTIIKNNIRLVICMGSLALQTLYADRGLENLSAYHMAGYCFPDPQLGAWVTVIPNLDEILATTKNQESQLLDFSRQLRTAIGYLYVGDPPNVDYNTKVKVLTEYYDVMQALTSVLDNRPEWFDFDYESNSLKPQFPKSQLYSVSWSVDDDVAYSHPFGGWGHFSEKQLSDMYGVFKAIMADERIKKSAHNIHMENSWTEFKLGQPVAGWGWDSMVAAHMLNTTTGTKGLKFQVFANFGFGPYNTHIKPYLEAVGDTPYNTIDKCDKMQLLHYGGLDSVFGRALRQLQMKKMRVGKNVPNRIRDCFLSLYLPGAETMSNMSLNGIRIDIDQYEKSRTECLAEQRTLEAEIQKDPAVQQFKKLYGPVFSLSADDDVRKLVFDILGCTAKRTTATGLESVDREMLEEIDHPLAKMMLRWRKLEKITGTFISQYVREAADGYMHPDYNLHIARSGRSSSSRPNQQNVPKRDKWSKAILRSGLYPKFGYRLTETDFGSQEIRVFTCHTKDPVLIDYLVHGGDMHYDEAVHVFALNGREQVAKEHRNCMKMGWNFALLYGSYYRACANKMWEEIVMRGLRLLDPNSEDGYGITVKEHLANKGVRNLQDFIEWCRLREKEFWEKFNVTKAYRERAIALYRERGYVETLFGFRRSGYLSDNMVVNTPTQGSGFQCLLWVSNELRREIKQRKWRTYLCGQVHDSLLSGVHPEEFQEYTELQHYYMTQKIREVFDFLIVPLEAETDAGDVDQPWSSLKPLEKVNGVWRYKEK